MTAFGRTSEPKSAPATAPPRPAVVAIACSLIFGMARHEDRFMLMSFALALTAVTGVIPTSIVYQLFIRTFSATLAPDNASAYLSGQSYAFGISAFLLILCTFFSLNTGKQTSADHRNPSKNTLRVRMLHSE